MLFITKIDQRTESVNDTCVKNYHILEEEK